MVIYIYGSDAFKKEIHSVLNHSNIKFRLDEHGEIRDLKTLEELKEAIQDNPQNIYLIDDDKIIKKNAINQKLKFLKPKDGIEQEYLLDNGIGDISVDSIEELSKHIIKRLESLDLENKSSDIQDSIVEIVEDAYENSDDSDYIQLDDELSALLSHEEEKKAQTSDDVCDNELLASMEEFQKKNDGLSSNDNEVDDELSVLLSGEVETFEDDLEEQNNDLSGLDDELTALLSLGEEDNDYDDPLDDINSLVDGTEELSDDVSEFEDLSFDEDLANIIDNIEDTNSTEDLVSMEEESFEAKEISQGDNMAADEFSEFDTLNEADLLAALNEIDGSSPTPPVENAKPVASTSTPASSSENVDITGSNVNDIAELISKLLNNKTLEITVKVKD